MEECPEVSIAFQDDVCTASAIAAVRSAQGGELVAHEVLVARATVAAATKNSDLVYKVAFLHKNDWLQIYPMLGAWPEMKDPGFDRDLICSSGNELLNQEFLLVGLAAFCSAEFDEIESMCLFRGQQHR